MDARSKPLKEAQPELARRLAAEEARLFAAQTRERTAATRGLLYVALLMLVGLALIAGRERVFPAGWWRQW
ncbi:hypothetical protein ACFQBQ_14115 [Granulicella cerasi]|uniref:Uncharacterized protein n=1 Tax=Granulicella cerasi TaxID=741063 RepID=A0ABW1ZE45_9BACT